MSTFATIWDTIKIPFRVLYKLYFLTVFFTSVIVVYPYARWLLQDKSRWGRVFRVIKVASRFVRFLTGVVIRYESKRHLPPPPYVVVANHASYIDTFLVYAAVPDYFVFLGKGELGNWPFFKIFFTSGMNILVHRTSKMASHRAYREAHERLDQKDCIAIFPEGGIMPKAPKLSRFKNGAFRLAIEHQVPIVPITLVNSALIFDSNRLLTGSGGPDWARIVVHPAVETRGLTDRDLVHLREQVFDTIQEALPEKWK